MSRVHGRDTRPEMYVRRAVWAEGFRFRLHVKKLPGKPDMVLPKYRLAVFIHGCFWHHHGCAKDRRPSSNREYWDRKLDGNAARDARHRAELEKLGWSVVTIWECRLKDGTEEPADTLKECSERSRLDDIPGIQRLGAFQQFIDCLCYLLAASFQFFQ